MTGPRIDWGEALVRLLRREGGFVDDPADRGGATKFGITAATLGAARGLGRAATPDEVRALTWPEAAEIYRARYLTGPGLDRIGDPWLAEFTLDGAVHSGPATAVRWLQRALGDVPVDGVLGPETLAALERARPEPVRRRMLALRMRYLGDLIRRDPRQARFAGGWASRLAEFAETLP